MQNKSIVITGSTRGIGLELAREFCRLGHQVCVNGRTEESVTRAVTELRVLNPELIGVAGDVSQEKTHLEIARQSIEKFGKIDIWINNAGIPQVYKTLEELNDSEIRGPIEVNIFGMVTGTRIALRFMKEQGFGKIYNMEGLGSDGRIINKLSLYGTTKRALTYFSRAVAKEMKDGPVQIGRLSPGMVRTDFIEDSMKSATPGEIRSFNKVFKILGEEPDVVARFLVKRILKSTKNNDRILFLSTSRLLLKLIRRVFKR